ncbi:hypothetical protein DFH06DRAFT_1194644 [Mycena polygramma]|nr:hypothetical protein DFH06DRAFT_1194644 [Mycena polygramma]
MSLFSSAPAPSTETCMSLQISCVPGPQSQSFEEVRIADYLTAFRATGRPPQPSPPYPLDPAMRAAQQLPPLFVPAPFPGVGSTSATPTATAPTSLFGGVSVPSAAASTSTAAAITDPARLPLPQTFAQPVVVPGAGTTEREVFVSIAAAGEYVHWSHEELRYYAYMRGMRTAPPGAAPFSLTLSSSSSAAAALGLASAFSNSAQGATPQDGDQYQSIVCRPEFAGHSVEELRLSFLRTGAELTSAQILAGVTSAPPSSIAPSLSSSLAPSLSQSQPSLTLTPAAPANAFGAPGLFGAAQPVGGGLFGAPANQPQTVGGGGGLGGGGLFASAPTQARTMNFGSAAAPVVRPTASPQQFGFGGFSFGGAPAPAQGGFAFGAPAAQSQGGGGGGGGGFSFGATPAATPGAGATGGGGTGFAFGGRRGF